MHSSIATLVLNAVERLTAACAWYLHCLRSKKRLVGRATWPPFALTCTAILALPTLAQNNEPTQLAVQSSASGFVIEEVVVTARKREEGLQDAPISITAVTGEALQLRQITSSDKLAQITPNLTFDSNAPTSGHSGAAQIYIRGIG